VHINLRNYYYLQKDIKLKEEIKNYCISIFEGIGMKVGFFLKGYGVLHDLNGTDLIPLLLKKILNSGYKLFLLGAKEEIVVKAINNLRKRFPGLNICGYNNGYFSGKFEPELLKKINESNADILLIGMGFPIQEKFVLKYKDKLKTSLIWNVGGLFDTLSGNKKRAPVILRKMRLEWLFRFVLEPGRMFHRNTVAAFWSLSHIIFSRRSKLL
jgi:N-acetylglucosaminyldiphosphoundecaprenol N-acetyl-beta-D-mannosaminyltransferase